METRADNVQEERAGLVALGLIMQLVGSIVAAYLVVRSLEEVLPYHLGLGPTRYFGDFYDFYDQENYDRAGLVSRAWHLPLLASLGIVRALLHRRAGGAILYRHRGRAGALHAYLAAALIHTGLCVAVFLQDRTSPTYQWSIAALLGAAWPMCLVVAATRPHFRRALRRGPAAMEDTAPDQLATLTIFLGLVGAMVALFVAYAGSERYWGDSPMGSNALVVIGVLLLVRAVVQLRSGLRVAGRATGASGPLATVRYVTVALVTSAFIGVGLVVHLSGVLRVDPVWMDGGHRFAQQFSSSVAAHLLAAYMVVVWPLLLQRFVEARKTATSSVAERSRPGSSLAALGWFLLAAGALQAAFGLLGLIADTTGMYIAWDWGNHSVYLVNSAPRSGLLQLLVAIPQIWTAVELLGATRRRRTAATAFAACGCLAMVVSGLDELHYLMRLIGAGFGSPSALVAYLQFAFPLLVPIATLVFVQHHLRRETPSQPVNR